METGAMGSFMNRGEEGRCSMKQKGGSYECLISSVDGFLRRKLDVRVWNWETWHGT
jgi:hypothetical protein